MFWVKEQNCCLQLVKNSPSNGDLTITHLLMDLLTSTRVGEAAFAPHPKLYKAKEMTKTATTSPQMRNNVNNQPFKKALLTSDFFDEAMLEHELRSCLKHSKSYKICDDEELRIGVTTNSKRAYERPKTPLPGNLSASAEEEAVHVH
jgi:hypothetical protein